MSFVADFHIHSKYSRATSSRMDLENLDKWARIKGIKILGTGDFTHPLWFSELKEKLELAEPGLYRLKAQTTINPTAFLEEGRDYFQQLRMGEGPVIPENEVRFILTTEISCIYSKKGGVKKIHVILFSPSFTVCEKINAHLGWIGNLKSDGRPILGLDAKELAKIILNISPDCLVVPAHIYTPWFSVFGSHSGFDSIDECFEDYSRYIYACETGLSSDPPMSWRNSALDKITLISNSDSHSPSHLGREANVFGTETSYPAIIEAIKSKNPQKLLYTIEFFPQEGKYHYDGHRLCGISLSPQESKKYNNICPRCGRALTIGVLNRVEKLADRALDFRPEGAIPFKSLVPLEEIIAESINQTVGTKQVLEEYNKLIMGWGNEFRVLLDASRQELESTTLPEIAEGIIRVREGKIYAIPGYDGVYGKIEIFSHEERKELPQQKTLF